MPPRGPRYSEAQAREAVAASASYSEALRRLGMRPAGGDRRTLRRYVEEVWRIPVGHLDPGAARRHVPHRNPVPLDEVLVEGSRYQRARPKERVFESGLKERCELCGQGEVWHGRRMSLILDHADGVADDNRLANLRIVCPNCNATLETHCGRNNARPPIERACLLCGRAFRPRSECHRYCSRSRGPRAPRQRGPRLAARRVERPPCEQLLAEIAELGYAGVGRRHGVSDKAIRKWRLAYERELEGRAVPPAGAAAAGSSAEAGVLANAHSPPTSL